MSRRGAPSGECASCHHTVPRLELDHRKPLWAGGANDNRNLQWLCPSCHRKKTTSEMRSAAYRSRIGKRQLYRPKGNTKLRVFVFILVVVIFAAMIF